MDILDAAAGAIGPASHHPSSHNGVRLISGPLRLDVPTFRELLRQQGPSLGLWRAAEVAALREQVYERPLLDLGCGDGLVTSLVLSQVDIGLDPDATMLARAMQLGVHQRFECTAAEEMALADASIATVVSNSVLEHLPWLDTALDAIARVLRPGGRLIFTAPTAAFSHELALPSACYATWRNRQLAHRNLWSLSRWARHLAHVGLRVEAVRPYLRPALVRAWDALELTQEIWIARRRLISLLWRRISPSRLDQLAHWAAQLDLSASLPGGGCLIVARKW